MPGLVTPNQVVQGLNAVLVSASSAAGQFSYALLSVERSFHVVGQAINELQREVVSFVQYANPAAVVRFNIALQDMQGVIGRMLVPVLINATAIIQKMADYLWALDEPTKKFIAGMIGAGIGLTTTVATLLAFTAVLRILALTITYTLTGSLLPFVGGIVVLAAAALGFAAATGKMDRLKAVMDDLGQIMTELATYVGPILTIALEALAEGLHGVLVVVKFLMPILGPLAAAFTILGVVLVSVAVLARLAAAGLAMLSVSMTFLSRNPLLASLILIGAAIAAAQAGANKPGEIPGKAPGAVRPVQTGDISSFINRQYAAALQGMPQGGEKPVLERIFEQVAQINRQIKENIPKQGQPQGPAAIHDPVVAQPAWGGWAAARNFMNQLGGK